MGYLKAIWLAVKRNPVFKIGGSIIAILGLGGIGGDAQGWINAIKWFLSLITTMNQDIFRCVLIVGGLAIVFMPEITRGLKRRFPDIIRIEPLIAEWAKSFNIQCSKIDSNSSFFTYVLTLPNKVPITVHRQKIIPRYLSFESALALSPPHEILWNKLKQDRQTHVTEELSLEMARIGIEFTVKLPKIYFGETIPITPEFGESDFLAQVNKINFAHVLARNAIVLLLKDSQPIKAKRS